MFVKKLMILLLLVSFTFYTYADSPCSSFIIKCTYYTNTNRSHTAYIHYYGFSDNVLIFNYIDEYYTINHRFSQKQIQFEKIPKLDTSDYKKVLAVNTSLFNDTVGIQMNTDYVSAKQIPIATHFYKHGIYDTSCNYFALKSLDDSTYAVDTFSTIYSDTIVYAPTQILQFDSVLAIVLDTILWCGDFNQIQWLNEKQCQIFLHKDIYRHFIVADDNCGQQWLDFICFNSRWDENRILSKINLKGLARSFSEFGRINVVENFSPSLQKAIRHNKVFCLSRWSP